MTIHDREPRVLIWDIESTNLNASFGTILCIGYKWLHNKSVFVPTIMDKGNKNMLDDKALVTKFATAFGMCDYHVTWYGDRFDLPMVKAKMIKHGLPPLPPKPSVDLWKTARYGFKIHNNRLMSWQEFLGVEHSKTAIKFDDWLQAATGDKEALAEVVDHCTKDVLVLEDVFLKFQPWITNLPNRGLVNDRADKFACQSCGSSHVTKQGIRHALTRKYQQYQCQDCGKWMRERMNIKPKEGALKLIGT